MAAPDALPLVSGIQPASPSSPLKRPAAAGLATTEQQAQAVTAFAVCAYSSIWSKFM